MTGVQLKRDLRDLGVAERRIRAFVRAGGDTGPLMDEIGNSLRNSTDQRFEAERGPEGEPWQKSIRAWFRGGKTLTNSGRLRQSITHRHGDRVVEVGTNTIYAGIHQKGGVIRAKTAKALRFSVLGELVQKRSVRMPARPFLGIDDDDRQEIGAIVDDFFARPLGTGR